MTKPNLSVDDALAAAERLNRDVSSDPDSVGWRNVTRVLADEVLRLRRGEFICRKCGLRKDPEPGDIKCHF